MITYQAELSSARQFAQIEEGGDALPLLMPAGSFTIASCSDRQPALLQRIDVGLEELEGLKLFWKGASAKIGD